MPKYRKKPIVVEAIKYDSIASLMKFTAMTLIDYNTNPLCYVKEGISISTREGSMLISPGDYLIRGADYELYPCKAHIFEATYEKVE